MSKGREVLKRILVTEHRGAKALKKYVLSERKNDNCRSRKISPKNPRDEGEEKTHLEMRDAGAKM